MQALELASLQAVLTFLVILSYAVVVLVTVKSRRTTVELQQMVLELRAKELGKIKSAVVPQVPLGPPSILVGAPPPRIQPAPVRRAVVRPAPSVARPIPAAAPQRRVVHEKIEVTKRRRIEESTPGVPGSEEIIEEEEEVETRPDEIRMEEPVVVTTRPTRSQESPVAVAPEPPPPTITSRDLTPLRYVIRSTEPPVPMGDARAKVLKDDPIARKGREALRQQLLEARGRSGKIHEILESQLKKGVISKQTYKELMERVGPP
ncbi:MAG: hypothetical protein HY558_02405, partial [Euryarchaeota archaeon]|nr:hypothetical protein [Euryarchaeota archaeon]